MAKNGWKTCGHCEGSGVCKNKLKGFQTIFWFIPFPIKVSDASCLMAEGIDPAKMDATVKCSVCKGTGFVYLDPNGERRMQMPPLKN
jgi:hypothetical protein